MMFSLTRGSVQPDNYSRDVTFFVMTALVLGGLAKVTGSIVGPMLYWGLRFLDVFLNETKRRAAGSGSKCRRSPIEPGRAGPFMLLALMLVL